MIQPVAIRLRSLLEENPRRSTSSLILTGHSAGGAVASLLYAHMMADAVRSELNVLSGCMFFHDDCTVVRSLANSNGIPSRLQAYPLYYFRLTAHFSPSVVEIRQSTIP